MPDFQARAGGRPRRIEHAYIDRDGTPHLPIYDAAHIRQSIDDFAGTAFATDADREAARVLILRAAGRYGMDVSKATGIRRREPNRRQP